jgi:pyruvate dehydrogenase E2 component (dihydrolipoamide acetyltransferase)
MSKLVDVKVPDLGGSAGVPIIELLVKDGDSVAAEGVLLVLESDKATMEVPSPAAGVIRNLKVKVGDKLSAGDLIGQLEVAEAGADKQETGNQKRATEVPASAAVPVAKVAQAAPAPVSVSRPPSGATRVVVPDIGDYKNVPVIELLVAEGAAVAKDAPLLVLESDKATMEVPAPAAGTVRGLKVNVGDRLSPGDFICELEGAAASLLSVAEVGVKAQGEEAPSPQQAAAAVPTAAARKQEEAGRADAAASSTPTPLPSGEESTSHAGPATRKFARELGVDLARVQGSGPKGRILIEDVQAHVKGRLQSSAGSAAPAAGGSGIPPIPAQDFSQYGPIERKELARIRKISAAHLSRAWLNVPHVTQFDEADITELEAFRKQAGEDTGVKLTLLPFLMKAVATAMRQFPEFNSSLAPEGDALILKQYCHIGFAADTPNGLVVPVVKDVWSKGIVELASACADLAKKARDGKLKPDEMRGGCFSISSLGGLGVTGGFTPIVNAPEVAILGVSKASMKPVWDGKAFQPRLMLPLSLSYDHRVIDGAYAARFTVALVKLLSDLRRLAL